MNAQFLVGPIVGAVIGYITNGIAIKMLFRPLKPIYIGKIKLPFTPGMIPKERDRIAQSVAQVVGKELLDGPTLKKHLLSQDIYFKIERSIEEWIATQQHSDKALKEVLYQLATEKNVDLIVESCKKQLTTLSYEKIVNLQLGKPLAATACQEIKGNLGALAMFLNDSLIATAEAKLEEIINQMISDQAEELIYQVIHQEGDALLDMPMKDLAEKLETVLSKIKYVLMKQYTSLIENHLLQMLETVDIPQIVEEKIKSYDLLEMEKIILGIMEKELKAIVWLGALLGGIMGIVMSIF